MIACRGRNGWFELKSVETLASNSETYIDLFSKSRGKMPPVEIVGSKEEVLELCNQIIAMIKKDGTGRLTWTP